MSNGLSRLGDAAPAAQQVSRDDEDRGHWDRRKLRGPGCPSGQQAQPHSGWSGQHMGGQMREMDGHATQTISEEAAHLLSTNGTALFCCFFNS